MTIYDVIKNKKLQDDINGVAARISVLSSGNIGKYEYLRGQEVLPSSYTQVLEQTKFTYSLLEKALEKQRKTIEYPVRKHWKAIEYAAENQTKALNTLSTDQKLISINFRG